MDLSRATPIPRLAATYMLVMGAGFIAAGPARFSSQMRRRRWGPVSYRLYGPMYVGLDALMAQRSTRSRNRLSLGVGFT